MKLLTVTVPCYNSEDYMRHCIETLLPGGDSLEILIINDGSSDQTAAIADTLASEHPDIIRVIHQENKGHGGAVMTGIANASGLFFKVVDSDDWVDSDVLKKILNILQQMQLQNQTIDMFVSNFVYDKVGSHHKKVMKYDNALPEGRVLNWDDVGKLHIGQYLLMHSVIYRTDVLRHCGLKLPEHTFYVDNLFVYVPMTAVRKFYYLNEDFYHYFIGREGQSVEEDIMIQRIDQQIKVNKLMLDQVDLTQISNKRLAQYLFSYLEIITTVSTILLYRGGTPEHIAKSRELWHYIKEHDEQVYRKLRHRVFGFIFNLPGKGSRRLATTVYAISRKIYGFN